ncbi:hypothetical protein A2996_00215 [Candidatus Campbellbacteria bacterium RIFCSPLOWO2_01_FULL_34_15]|uniref:Uncharacterized protein n=1 Tax=Candidatus Campbellbacteria bacterium RIFCSPLOWO2_01_FULL_34_15 TaxID=1797579 RepID=A0A1F5EP34_9BACT|nr:MAG: hypothetical protein A2996_00215 [Candidatus Campbellbacteria bacterium RIFCSPLOWO2_01_FULL_34_15]
MTLLFYLLFVWISDAITFSWIWFIVALLFSAKPTRTVYEYIYTNDPELADDNFETTFTEEDSEI